MAGSKFHEHFLKKATQRNIPVKLFQNLASSFGEEDYFKNFFLSIYCKKPPFTRAMFMDGSKFRKHFLKRVTKDHSSEIISKSDQQFRRRRFFKNFFMYLYSARSPNSSEQCFLADQHFANNS